MNEIKITFRMIVNDGNVDGAPKLHDTLAGFIAQLKQDFNEDLLHHEGRVDVTEYNGPIPPEVKPLTPAVKKAT